MGSIPTLSILRGGQQPFSAEDWRLQLHRLFEQRAAAHGDQPAVLDCDGAQLMYAALDMRSSRLARALMRRAHTLTATANQDGDHLVAVSMDPSERLLVTLLAVWKIGAAYLPLDPAFPATRVAHILKEARPILVITDRVDLDVFGGHSNVLTFSELEQESSALSSKPIPDAEAFNAGNASLALVLYTSGSTGVPKGVRLPHRVVLNRLRWQWRAFPFRAEERVCVFKTALTFVDSVSELWGPLLQGRAVLVVPREVTRDPEQLVAVLERYKIERLVLVPSLLRALLLFLDLNPGSQQLSGLRLWVCSGEPLNPDLAAEFFDRFPNGRQTLCNFYGSTEIMGDVTYHVLASSQDVHVHDKIPIGRPLDNTLVYLLDQHLQPVKPGDVGQLFVSGLNLADGYVNGRDADRFQANPHAVDPEHSRLYRTGDFARLEKATLIYEGRTDSQIKVRGHRVDLSEVEHAVLGSRGVNRGIVLCHRPGEIDQALLAFITTTEDLSSNEIEVTLQGKLTSYMLPQVIIMDSIPLLVNGKMDRQSLLRSYEESKNSESPPSQNMFKVNHGNLFASCKVARNAEMDYRGVPQDKMEAAKVLFETVATVLGSGVRGKLEARSNFYSLGGNSLNSVYTVTRLRDQGYIIGIGDFINCPTLEAALDRMYRQDDEETAALLRAKRLQCRHHKMEMLANSHRSSVTSMVTSSFYEKADLERWLMPHVYEEDYTDLMEKLWQPLVEKDLSFVVKDDEGRTIGVALNFDVHDEPQVEIHTKLIVVFDFLEHLEGPIRDTRLPQGRQQVLHSFMMATDASLSPRDNVEVMDLMEEEVLRLARRRGFAGIFTTNTSPLTQQLGTDVYDYQMLLDYQVNQYVAADGTKPFERAPDEQRAICSWRPV